MRQLCIVLLSPFALSLSGCASVKVSDIPNPFDETLGFGEAITDIRIEGNAYTRESLILRAMASK